MGLQKTIKEKLKITHIPSTQKKKKTKHIAFGVPQSQS